VAKGTDELRRWHERFFSAVKDYRLSKTLRAASGNVITVEFAERWVSTRDGQGKEGFGGEFWTINGDRLAKWHLYYRSWPAIEPT
jgi:nuclear transport factor 2 (NTF2) superfamily protein